MRKTFIILISLLAIAIFASAQKGAAQVQPRGVTVESVAEHLAGTPAPAGREIPGKKYAVLVGVTEYQNMTDLRFTKNDAEALRDQLHKIGFAPENVRTLTSGGSGNDEPTKSNIENAVRDTLGRAKEGDLVIIALSGHGTQPDHDPFFCPPEADRGNLRNTTVSINKIRDDMGDCNASFKLLIVDACRDDNPFGLAMTGVRTIPVSRSIDNADSLGFKGVTLESVDANAPLRNLTVFQSCSRGEISWEDGRLNHGIFTHFIVEGLRGQAANSRGDITMDRLLSYARDETSHYVENIIQRQQNPWRAGEGNDFVLANINRQQSPYVPRNIRRITTLDLPQQPNELPTMPEGKHVANARELRDAISKGGVIILKPGTYTLDNLNITGNNRPGEPVVLFGDPSDPEKVQIRIRNGRINITNRNAALIGLDISSPNGNGIRVEGEAEVDILFCLIRDCKENGIYNSAQIFVESSVITSNGNGLFTSRGKSDVNNSRIAYNNRYGVLVTRTAKGRFSDNILFDNFIGNWKVDGIVQER